MPLFNQSYTNIASQFGMPLFGVSGLPPTGGNVFWVNSVNGSDGNTGGPQDPFATLAQAMTAAQATNGDMIVLLPGHAETIVAAGGITASKAGLTVVGLGEGSARPTFTFSTSTAATFLITGANFSIQNVVAVCNIASLVTGFDVRASDCTLGVAGAPIEWHDTSNAVSALRGVLTTAAADRLNITMNYFATTGGLGVNAIRLVGCDTGNININYYGIVTTAVVEFLTTACTNIEVSGYMYVSGTTNFSKDVVDTVTGSTWFASFMDGSAGVPVIGGSGSALAANTGSTTTISNNIEKAVITTAAVMSNGLAVFTVTGPVEIIAIGAICATANGATASTLQYSSSGTLGSTTQTITGATASLANATAGTTIAGILTALSTAPTVNANAAALISTGPSSILVPAGSITAVVGVGSTTGTWQHFLRYKPLSPGATVTAAF